MLYCTRVHCVVQDRIAGVTKWTSCLSVVSFRSRLGVTECPMALSAQRPLNARPAVSSRYPLLCNNCDHSLFCSFIKALPPRHVLGHTFASCLLKAMIAESPLNSLTRHHDHLTTPRPAGSWRKGGGMEVVLVNWFPAKRCTYMWHVQGIRSACNEQQGKHKHLRQGCVSPKVSGNGKRCSPAKLDFVHFQLNNRRLKRSAQA